MSVDTLELSLLDLYDRILQKKDIIGLKGFRRTPTRPIKEKYLPCVAMLEGTDTVIQHSSRNGAGYPCTRVLEVTLELFTNKNDTDIKAVYKLLRKYTFLKQEDDTNPGEFIEPKLNGGGFIRENRKEGPVGYGLPDVKVMRLVLDLTYNDGGF